MPNPYESTDSVTEDQNRCSVWRSISAVPFFLFGAVWCLMFIRTPDRIAEAWSRFYSDGWGSVISDAAFSESLWRCTVLPLTGLGFVCIGVGILRRKVLVWFLGAAWAIVVFAVGSFGLR